jgi:hypothetical protein
MEQRLGQGVEVEVEAEVEAELGVELGAEKATETAQQPAKMKGTALTTTCPDQAAARFFWRTCIGRSLQLCRKKR